MRKAKVRPSVLIVEDNTIDRELLAEILGEYDVLQAVDGAEGLEILNLHYNEISVVLLDVIMPNMDGYDFLKEWKKDAKVASIPIIVITGIDSAEQELKCLELGATDFIRKPYNPKVIQTRVANTIKLRQSIQALALADYDELTEVKNRNAYYQDVEILEEQNRKKTRPVGIVYLDINGLKSTNDELGHKKGDRLLRTIAKQMKQVFSKEDIYRVGGDEFVILDKKSSKEEFELLVEELNSNWTSEVSAAVGSVWLSCAQDIEKQVAQADDKMYEDKNRHYQKLMNQQSGGLVINNQTLPVIKQVADSLPGGFFIYQVGGKEEFIYYNDVLMDLTGCCSKEEFEELTGNSFRGIVYHEDVERVEQEICQQIGFGQTDYVEYRLNTKDKREVLVRDYGRYVHTQGYGDVFYVFVVEK